MQVTHPMKEVPLKLMSIHEIARGSKRFFIPSYQRGYRWEEDQVKALLDDLEEYAKSKDAAGFYCLQPLVVVEQGDWWSVVDGQQRLTTLFLIMQELQPKEAPRFQIQYERHPEHQDGLEGLLGELAVTSASSRARSLPDFHYLLNAKTTIAKWLSAHPGHSLGGLGVSESPSVKFIWYQLAEADAVRAFSRLNAGKIRLTDSELIRALFLRVGGLSEAERLNLAVRWDHIERRLQEPEFWAFLTKKGYTPENRIELIFTQMARDAGVKVMQSARATYDYFHSKLHSDPSGSSRRSMWEQVEDRFSHFEEWFESDQHFHLVGFLIESGVSLESLVAESFGKGASKSDFLLHLRREVRVKVLPGVEPLTDAAIKKHLEGIRYLESSHEEIRMVLLCVNLAMLLADRTGTVRFSFQAYKDDSWDIEHVRASASRGPKDRKELVAALDVIMAYEAKLGDQEDHAKLREDYQRLLRDGRQEDLTALYTKCLERFEVIGEIESSNDISNLALLDAGTNRGYGNSPFPVKRDWILAAEHQAKYVLPATRAVFTKSFSLKPANLLAWSSKDADDYLNAMARFLANFFKPPVHEAP